MIIRACSATPLRISAAMLSVLVFEGVAAYGQSREPVVATIPPAPASSQPGGAEPLHQPPASASDLFRELQRKPVPSRTAADRALLVGLEFCLAAGVGGGTDAARLIDAVGYQALPLEGALPLDPPRSVPAARIAEHINGLPESGVDRIFASRFALVGKSELAARFAAAGEWMLPTDRALLLEPDPQRPHWIRRPACLIVRVRGADASIVAGNLFEALAPPTPASPAPSPGGGVPSSASHAQSRAAPDAGRNRAAEELPDAP